MCVNVVAFIDGCVRFVIYHLFLFFSIRRLEINPVKFCQMVTCYISYSMNRSALAVIYWVIIRCFDVSSKEDQITSSQ